MIRLQGLSGLTKYVGIFTTFGRDYVSKIGDFIDSCLMKLFKSIVCILMLSVAVGCDDEPSEIGACQENLKKDCICTMEYARSVDVTTRLTGTHALRGVTALQNLQQVLARIKMATCVHF